MCTGGKKRQVRQIGYIRESGELKRKEETDRMGLSQRAHAGWWQGAAAHSQDLRTARPPHTPFIRSCFSGNYGKSWQLFRRRLAGSFSSTNGGGSGRAGMSLLA